MTSPKFDSYIAKLSEFKTASIASTGSDGKPDCATVFFAYEPDGALLFATSHTTQKAQNLGKNNRVAASMDDRVQTGIQLRGRATRLEGADATYAQAALLKRHPSIGSFLKRDGVIYFKLVPQEVFLINFAWGVDWRIAINKSG